MPKEPKEPMINQENRPTAIDLDAPINELRLRDLMGVISSQIIEYQKGDQFKELSKPEKEILKGDQFKEKEIVKGDHFKVEKEIRKVEKEILKPEKEFIKPELTKPESFKPETAKPDPGLVDKIADRVVQKLREQGIIKGQ